MKASIGKSVLYWQTPPEWGVTTYPQAAIITFVHSQECVNLVVWDHNGVAKQRLMIPLGEREGGNYCVFPKETLTLKARG